jgi:hypothetical protein
MNFKDVADKLYSRLEREEVNGEIVYTKKRQVYPVINEEGEINWFNFLTGGTYWKLIGIIIFIVIMVGFVFEYHYNFKVCADLMNQQNLAKNITNLLNPLISP